MAMRTTRKRFFTCASLLAILAASASASAEGVRYKYDSTNRLIAIQQGSELTEISYDAFGDVAKICRGDACEDIMVDDSSGLSKVVARVDASGRAALVSQAPAGAAATKARDGSIWYALRDQILTARGYVRGSDENGRRVDEAPRRVARDPYGMLRSSEAVPPEVADGLSGELELAEDAVWLRSRTYLADQGTFAQRDSFIGTLPSPDLNRYSYTSNAPVSRTDRTGYSSDFDAIDIEIHDNYNDLRPRLSSFQDTLGGGPLLNELVVHQATRRLSPKSLIVWAHGRSDSVYMIPPGLFRTFPQDAHAVADQMSQRGIENLLLMSCNSCRASGDRWQRSLAAKVLNSYANKTIKRVSGAYTGFETKLAWDDEIAGVTHTFPDARPRAIDTKDPLRSTTEEIFHEIALVNGQLERRVEKGTVHEIIERMVKYQKGELLGVVPVLGWVIAGHDSAQQRGWKRQLLPLANEAFLPLGVINTITSDDTSMKAVSDGMHFYASPYGYGGL